MEKQIQDTKSDFPAQLKYEQISAKNEEWDGGYLRRLRAFYKGGKALLQDDEIMEEVFPKQGREDQAVYDLRRRLAFYVNYAGEILNFITSSLSAERLSIALDSDDEENPRPIDAWYEGWIKDVSPKGGKTVSLHDYSRMAVLEALITRVAWARVDMPPKGDYQNQAEQEKAGALSPFTVLVQAECVIDWDEDDSGELELCVVHTCESKRKSLTDSRSKITEVFRVYTPTDWARYELIHDKDKEPTPDMLVTLVAAGPHSFKRVPMVRIDVGDGLWAMDNIEGACREHLNSRNNLAWYARQAANQELYEFLGPEDETDQAPVGENQQSATRAVDKPRGPGYVQERGKDDDAKYVGPDMASFAEMRTLCGEIRDEIHRVTHQMALAADNSAAALGRSAESKGADKASAVVVFEALGALCRKFAEDLLNIVSTGRGDETLVNQWQASGMAKFDAISVDAFVAQAVDLATVTLHSPHAARLYELSLWKSVLGDEASEEDFKIIKEELADNITSESMQPLPKVDMSGDFKGSKPGDGATKKELPGVAAAA